jgi:hypothetical protein
MLWYNCQDNIVFILFRFKVVMFVVYFDYMLSIVSLSLCLYISSCSAHPNDHRVGGRDHVSMVLRCYLSTNTLYSGSCGRSQVWHYHWVLCIHSPNIGHRSRARLQMKGKLCSRTSRSNAPLCVDSMVILAMTFKCNCTNQCMLWLSGEALQWYNYLSACRILFIYILYLSSHIK